MRSAEYDASFMLADVQTNDILPADELQLCPSAFGPVAIFPQHSQSALVMARHGAPRGHGVSVGVWTPEGHGLFGTPSAVGALGHHALLHRRWGPTSALWRPSSTRWGRPTPRRARASPATCARGSSGWDTGSAAFPSRRPGTPWGVGCSSIALRLGDPSNMASTALKHLREDTPLTSQRKRDASVVT